MDSNVGAFHGVDPCYSAFFSGKCLRQAKVAPNVTTRKSERDSNSKDSRPRTISVVRDRGHKAWSQDDAVSASLAPQAHQLRPQSCKHIGAVDSAPMILVEWLLRSSDGRELARRTPMFGRFYSAPKANMKGTKAMNQQAPEHTKPLPSARNGFRTAKRFGIRCSSYSHLFDFDEWKKRWTNDVILEIVVPGMGTVRTTRLDTFWD